MHTHSENPKSGLTDFVLRLLIAALNDVATYTSYSTDEIWNDGREIVRRTKCEGLHFVTKALPSLGKAFDRALSSDDPFVLPEGFRAFSDDVVYPHLMWTHFERVFDQYGVVRSDADPRSVIAIRQVCYLFYKLELPYAPEQVEETISRFCQTEVTLRRETAYLSDLLPYVQDSTQVLPGHLLPHDPIVRILRTARAIVCRVFSTSDPRDENFRPRHGPGSVATGEQDEEKMNFARYYKALDAEFPYDKYFFYNLTHLSDQLQEFMSFEELESGTAKVVLVPKDSRGPRLISCEPLEYQWIQQMLKDNMVQTIESHGWSRGFVNFTSQEINRALALEASSGINPFVTVDMKDASDRVCVDLVRMLFPSTWSAALLAARTTATRLPSGEVVQLHKFAPMGSATCFPVEAMVFWALSIATIIHKHRRTAEYRSRFATQYWRRELGEGNRHMEVYVYGDDIILHREDYADVEQTLTAVGLMVNRDKCCTGRFFRESCGMDAFNGVPVTPLRMKTVLCHELTASDIIGLAAFHNACTEKHWPLMAETLRSEILSRIDLPVISYSDALFKTQHGGGLEALCLVAPEEVPLTQFHKPRRRYNRRLQRVEHKLWVARSRTIKCGEPSWGEMLRLASLRSEPSKEATIENLSFLERISPLTPDGGSLSGLIAWAKSVAPLVRACQYTPAHRVSLVRKWVSVMN